MLDDVETETENIIIFLQNEGPDESLVLCAKNLTTTDGSPAETAKDFICGSCDASFELRHELNHHLQRKHKEVYERITRFE